MKITNASIDLEGFHVPVFTEHNEFGNPEETTTIDWGDFDNDGDLDLAVGNKGSFFCLNYLFVNDGSGNFVGGQEFGIGMSVTTDVEWGDCDNDGYLDLAVANYGESNKIYTNDQAGGFNEMLLPGSDHTLDLVWGDYDNDGDLDLAESNDLGEQNYLYVNDAGSFTKNPEFGIDTSTTLAWSDYDMDFYLDIAVGNTNIENL